MRLGKRLSMQTYRKQASTGIIKRWGRKEYVGQNEYIKHVYKRPYCHIFSNKLLTNKYLIHYWHIVKMECITYFMIMIRNTCTLNASTKQFWSSSVGNWAWCLTAGKAQQTYIIIIYFYIIILYFYWFIYILLYSKYIII